MFLVSFAKIIFSHHKYDATEPQFLLTNFLYLLVKDVTGATAAFLLQKHWQDQHQHSILSIVNLGRQSLLPNRSQLSQTYTTDRYKKIHLFRRIHCYTRLSKNKKRSITTSKKIINHINVIHPLAMSSHTRTSTNPTSNVFRKVTHFPFKTARLLHPAASV